MKIFRTIKAIALLLLLSGMFTAASAQTKVVSWKTDAKEIGEDLYRIEIEATIEKGWHIYDLDPACPAMPTSFTFSYGEGARPEGSLKQQQEPTRVFDETYKEEIGYFEGKAVFTQDVRLSAEGATVEMFLEYMACNDMNCLPPADTTITFTLGEVSSATPVAVSAEDRALEAAQGSTTQATEDNAGTEIKAADSASVPAEAPSNLWSNIISAILWGLAMLLTPCVFPMVPMTVSFFLKGSDNKHLGRFRAAMYGLFIVLLYTVPIAAIIIITRIVGGDAVTADIFNWLATHWLPNIIFFLVFMIFAASFFGAFEITMPSKLVNKSDQNSNKKGLGGVFFMALTLVLVSFSCTGPIVGSVLIESVQGGKFWDPIITMLAFSIAFALPFTLFAFFPSVLKKLPKSGGWLNSVKVVLGFIELALGLKFLSTADQAYHWGLLDREIYLALWIVIFTLLGFYLLGKIRFKYDSPVEHVSLLRLVLSIIVFTFVVYMIPGMWGAPLKALSGYMPPMATQDYVVTSGGAVAQTTGTTGNVEGRKYADFLHLPHHLEGFFDYDEAIEYAKKVNKPVFIDFTGHACVNCREMEERVFSDPRILDMFRNDFVMVALYMDDKTEVDESEWVTTESGRVFKTLGKINTHIANERYNINAQPYYLIVDHEGNQLVPNRSYDLDIEEFIKFLEDGKKAFYGQEK